MALIDDQYQFNLHHQILWKGEDVDVAVPMVQEAQGLSPQLGACSFGGGFHSSGNPGEARRFAERQRPAGKRLSFEREPGARSGGLLCVGAACASGDRVGDQRTAASRTRPCPSHGADGFARAVALSVLAANLHRIGLIL